MKDDKKAMGNSAEERTEARPMEDQEMQGVAGGLFLDEYSKRDGRLYDIEAYPRD